MPENNSADEQNERFAEFADLCTQMVIDVSAKKCANVGKRTCIQKRRALRCHPCQAKLIIQFGEEILSDEERARAKTTTTQQG